MIGFCKIDEIKFKEFLPPSQKVGTGAPIEIIFFLLDYDKS